MGSINQNQPEQNRADLFGEGAIAKIKELVRPEQNCFFVTVSGNELFGAARPMNVRQIDDQGRLWFLSASDSRQNAEIAKNPRVLLHFQGSQHSDFLELRGRVTVTFDKPKIKELWEPVLKTWFTGGLDDPRISVLEFTPEDGYYWDTKHGASVAGIKMLIGAALGKTLDDSIEGRLSV